MRKQKTIEIEGVSVTVMEMTAADVLIYIDKLKTDIEDKPSADKMMKSLFMRSEEYREIIIRCVKCDVKPEDWGVSAWATVHGAFEEVNADFFDQCGQSLRLLAAGMGQQQSSG